MRAVIDIETSLGFIPRDVSADKRGYDVESHIPEKLRQGTASLRFIEVKGRAKGADTVTVTKNEILTAFNKPEEYILALVEVEFPQPTVNSELCPVNSALCTVHYLKKPFRERPDFAATSVNYNIVELLGGSEVILERGNWYER
jgi:hypothetical protein